jgi:Tfp pilus assembly protein PilP
MKNNKFKMIRVGVTNMYGTGAYRNFKANTPYEAIKKAMKKDGKESENWTYYCPDYPEVKQPKSKFDLDLEKVLKCIDRTKIRDIIHNNYDFSNM